MSRAVFFLLGALILTVAAAGCGGGGAGDSASTREAERVAVKWLQEMANSEVNPACRLMDAEQHRRDPDHPDWSPAEVCRERWLHSDNTPLNWKPKANVLSIWGEQHPKVLEVALDGDQAVVYIARIGQRRPIGLRRERGRWLVDEVEYPI